ncbi:MAG: LacI family transcriptional regulator [Algoriphagus sp.]|jgi:LacI family transcriptional regulator
MKKKTTIHDIAENLNVTASTVSRALNNNPRISLKTRKLVQQAAIKLNYQPNNIAAALRSGKSNIIGIIVPTADRSFFSSVIYGIEEIANTAGFNVMICQSHDNYENEVDKVQALLNAGVDGVIVSYAKETKDFKHFKKLINNGTPLILFDRSTNELEVSQVVIDDYLGAYMATEHLISQGYLRIAHFTSNAKISIYKDRLRGYQEALVAHRIPLDEDLIFESNLQLEDGRASMLEILSKGLNVDGLVSASALGAMGAMQVLKEHKIKVPDQFGIVGFANETFMSFTDPSLSTVEQHSKRIGNSAAELFLQEIASNQPKFIPQKIVLKPELIIRESSVRTGE